MKELIQKLIDYFGSIPEDQWCTDYAANNKGQHCAYGHMEKLGISNDQRHALSVYFTNKITGLSFINDGKCGKAFPQETPKQRVMAALEWALTQED
jgi:hypothetical protein